MARTLRPEDRIGHYRIVGPLGAGGMGEVYLARDLTLERDVALKVLPPELVRSEDRLRRFMLEARSASSLNHPHIVTIYEIGQDAVRSPDGAEQPELGAVHYIAMELVSGRTLQDMIHRERVDLKTLLGHLAQAAEGLAKAHAAGIVHRDLKPGNVMVSNDGYAKVLDFGLAKLAERGPVSEDRASAPTEALGMTGVGMVLGTVGYMAPEQVANRSVDHRADIFAFGCMLYEAATRHRAFVGETNVDSLHKILHAAPQPVDELNPEAPTDLRRLIRRCLTKNPDQRLQSMKDLALELREIVDHFDELSLAGTSASGLGLPALSGSLPRSLPAPSRSRSRWTGVAAGAVLLVGLSGATFGVWSLLGARRGPAVAPFSATRMRSLIGDPSLQTSTLSADGRYLAYVTGQEGRFDLAVRQVATGSVVQILAGQPVTIRGISFSPDGNYLYYLGRDPDAALYSALFEVPSLGGVPRKRLFDVDCAVGFSPDGRQVAFMRGVPQDNASRLVIADLATGAERVVATTTGTETLALVRPAWSPDGRTIVAMAQSRERGFQARLLAYDVDTGQARPIAVGKTAFIDSFAWLPDGRGLVATFGRAGSNAGLYHVPYPEGPVRQITNDLASYADLTLAAGGTSIALSRASVDTSLWSVSFAPPGEPRQLTTRSTDEGIGELVAAPDGTLYFTASRDQQRDLWSLAPGGTGRRQLSSLPGFVAKVRLHPTGGGIVFNQFTSENDAVIPHIYRMDLDGGNLRRLTEGSGELLESVSPDGKTVYFRPSDTITELWRVPFEGGKAEKYLEGVRGNVVFSADGRHLAYVTFDVSGLVREAWKVVDVSSAAPVASFDAAGRETFEARGRAPLQWHPDGSGLTYVGSADAARNLWLQPLGGGAARPLTGFGEGRITDHVASPDGTRIALERTIGTTSNLWIVNADGTRPERVTTFPTGAVFGFEWAKDGRSIYFTQGDPRVEVVLIHDESAPAA